VDYRSPVGIVFDDGLSAGRREVFERFNWIGGIPMTKDLAVVLILAFLLCGCEETEEVEAENEGGRKMEITITSSAFQDGGMIPSKYTCDGQDISPPLTWEGVPAGTKSLALISDDPDAPMGTWVHWVMYNIPPDIGELPENVPMDEVLSNGAKQGLTDFRRVGYGGPCPPSGTHRYFFKIYALDIVTDLDAGATKKQLLAAMKGHILAEGQLIGKYKRQ
jgi:Raf kinase inhibitor-like YbhB/YbcL family protein